MQKPLVSIITPLYNSEKFIAETIVSVLAQTYTNWEMLIVNDCSKDNGASIVEKYSKKDKRIKLFNNKKNMGVSFTRTIWFGFNIWSSVILCNALSKYLGFSFI